MLQGRAVRSVRVLVPDLRGLERNFGGVARIVSVFAGTIHDPPAIAACDPPSYGVATSGPGGNVRGSQRNHSAMPGRVVVPTVAHGYGVICIVMWLGFIWTWHSCGGVRCPGTRCGRARHRIVWIMFEGRMMFLGL